MSGRGPSADSSPIASLIAWPWSVSLVDRPVPDLHRVGPAGHLDDPARPPKAAANRSGSMVAEVMITFQVRAAGAAVP